MATEGRCVIAPLFLLYDYSFLAPGTDVQGGERWPIALRDRG